MFIFFTNTLKTFSKDLCLEAFFLLISLNIPEMTSTVLTVLFYDINTLIQSFRLFFYWHQNELIRSVLKFYAIKLLVGHPVNK